MLLLSAGCHAGSPQVAPSPSPSVNAASATAPAPNDADRGACVDLGSRDLPTRTDAARRIQTAHSLLVEGGSEQLMEAVGAWCRDTYRLPPPWMPQ
jgi:hypothetical protein